MSGRDVSACLHTSPWSRRGDEGMTTDSAIVLTPHGYDKIEKELEHLRTVERREVAERIRDSKQFGEFSENAEYEDAKIEQAFVEGRIQELRRILQISQVLSEQD